MAEKSGPEKVVMRFCFSGTSEMVAVPRMVSSPFLQLMAMSAIHSVAAEKPNILSRSLVAPISDDGMLMVIVCEAVAAVGVPAT